MKMLIANKCDLEERRVVSTSEGQNLAEALSIPFMETSAETNTGITEVVRIALGEEGRGGGRGAVRGGRGGVRDGREAGCGEGVGGRQGCGEGVGGRQGCGEGVGGRQGCGEGRWVGGRGEGRVRGRKENHKCHFLVRC